MKVCTKCKCEKDDSEFRIRFTKYKDKKYYGLNATCKSCDLLMAKENYEKNKNIPEFKRKNAQRVRDYRNKEIDKIKARRSTEEYRKQHNQWELNRYHLKKDEINARQREKRKTPEYKAYMKEYRAKNKERIYQQEVITKERYHEKNKKQLTDKYIIRLFLSNGFPYPTPIEIEMKRAEVLISRLRKFTSKKKIGILKKCNRCEELKDKSEFYINGNNKITYICKKCSNEKCREYREQKKHNRTSGSSRNC